MREYFSGLLRHMFHNDEPQPRKKKFNISYGKLPDIADSIIKRTGYVSLQQMLSELSRYYNLGEYSVDSVNGTVGSKLREFAERRKWNSKKLDGNPIYFPDMVFENQTSPQSINTVPVSVGELASELLPMGTLDAINAIELEEVEAPYDWRQHYEKPVTNDNGPQPAYTLMLVNGSNPVGFYLRLLRWDEQSGVIRKLIEEGYAGFGGHFHANKSKRDKGVRGGEFANQVARNIRLLFRCYEKDASIYVHPTDAYIKMDEPARRELDRIFTHLQSTEHK